MPHRVKKGDTPDHPSHGNHMQHFEVALTKALNEWNWPETATVTFEVDVQTTLETDVQPDPGGVKEYWVTLSS
jgi:hypothetical protein